ncbi:MAG: hypothetical protein Q7U64_02120 [Desulfocapsaceae bacterium]|nr:hypothetical protein [Desulfocapsaceae bacterium]
MRKKSKITDNPSAKDILDKINVFDGFESLYRAIPFSKKIFPKLDKVFSDFSKLKEQASMLLIPDQFNHLFSQHGWIAYESMKLDVMKKAIDLCETEGLSKAEEYLATSYDEETLKWGILRFNGNRDFRRRIRLIELAKEDYLSGRYHGCIPLLLSLLDGLVNDVSKHVGFFAENIDLIAWDCIAAHETGLQTLASILTKGRNKTNEEAISIPFRNGILHGRELAFDNKIVAAKCWAAVFAARDWAGALDEGKKDPKPQEEVSWRKLFSQMAETSRMKKAIDEWRPRTTGESSHLPFSGDCSKLPLNSPERSVGEFVEHWCKKRFGLVADALLYFTDTSKGKKAGLAKQDFGRHVPISFKILNVEDQAASVSHVVVKLYFEIENETVSKEVSVRAIYQDKENNPSVRTLPGGYWKIVQNSFSEIIYSSNL